MYNRDHNIKEKESTIMVSVKIVWAKHIRTKRKREKDTWRDEPQETAKCVYKFSKTAGLKGVALMGKA